MVGGQETGVRVAVLEWTAGGQETLVPALECSAASMVACPSIGFLSAETPVVTRSLEAVRPERRLHHRRVEQGGPASNVVPLTVKHGVYNAEN